MTKNAVSTSSYHGLGNKSIVLRILIILFGFLFFWFSSYLFPNGNAYLRTPIGASTEIAADHYVTLNSWEYSKNQKEMIVELLCNNKSFDGNNEYHFEAYMRNSSVKQLATEILLEDKDLTVVRILDVPNNFNEVSLRVYLAGKQYETQYAKLYTNKRDVEQVDSFVALTPTEYKIQSLERQIERCNDTIAQLQEDIAQIQGKIEEVQNTNVQIEEDKRYMTASEIQDANRQIQSNEQLVTQYNAAIQADRNAIAENQQKIEKLNLEIDDIKEG